MLHNLLFVCQILNGSFLHFQGLLLDHKDYLKEICLIIYEGTIGRCYDRSDLSRVHINICVHFMNSSLLQFGNALSMCNYAYSKFTKRYM